MQTYRAWQFRPSTHDLHVLPVAEKTVSFLGGKLAHDAKFLQLSQRLINGSWTQPSPLHQPGRCRNGTLYQGSMDLQGRSCRTAKSLDLVTILVRQVEKLLGSLYRLSSSDDDGLGKEIEPCLPISGQPNLVEQIVVVLTVSLEVEAEYSIGSRRTLCSHNSSVISRRPRRPLPSRNGWMVSN